MPAIFYILICFLTGWSVKRIFRIDASELFRRIADDPSGNSVHPPAWTFDIPFSLIAGTTIVTTIHYFLSYAAHFVFAGTGINPLLISNIIIFTACAGLAAAYAVKRLLPAIKAGGSVGSASSRITGYFADTPRLYALTLWFFGLFAIFLIFYSFFVKDNILHSGYTVFSDFAPHTAVISSFAYGDNFPTGYPHFAGDGIQYHFFFFYLCANLLFLGMRFDFAMNIPSILGILSFTTLLGSFGVLLTRRRPVFLLAPLMLFFRSSYAIFDYLRELSAENGATFFSILKRIAGTDRFIGTTLHDDWGLWAMNVYANQRHFLWGMSIFMIVIFIVYPTIHKRTATASGSWPDAARNYFIAPGRWKIADPGPLIPAITLTACLSYWHGSVLIALLAVLFVMAFFAYERLAYIFLAVSGVAASFVLSAFFSGGAANVVSPSFLWGFISEDKSLSGVGTYLFKVIGISLLLIVVTPFITARRDSRIFAAAAMTPIVFALTVSLTPDVTVNHKYIIIAVSLLNIFIADLYCSLWDVVKRLRKGNVVVFLSAAILALFIGFSLFSTGVVELIGYTNKNRNSVSIDLQSPLTEWIKENTDSADVFLTAPYHMNVFFFSGRKVFYGWPYYTMTAGHDTDARIQLVHELFRGCGGDKEAFTAIARTYHIKYAIIDNALLNDSGYPVDTAFFELNFKKAAEFPQLAGTTVYKLFD
ncbi:MAG: hypothetical protein ACYCYM_09245 [Saccharofermentanales bacterium]